MTSEETARQVRWNLESRRLLPLADEISVRAGVPLMLLLGKSRHKSVAEARRELYFALRCCALSLPEIGKILLRDHTTILAGLRSREHGKRIADAPSGLRLRVG